MKQSLFVLALFLEDTSSISLEQLAKRNLPWGPNMNWNYDSLPGCDTMEKNVQVPFPYCGANCNPKNNKPAEEGKADAAAFMQVSQGKD